MTINLLLVFGKIDKPHSTRISLAFGSRSAAVGNGEHASTCQSLRTYCKELIAMINKLYVWPSFATQLERIEMLQISFPDFNIIHIPRSFNQISDFLAKTARFFNKELHFIGCSISDHLKFE